MKRLRNGPLNGLQDNPKIKQFLAKCTKLYRCQNLANNQLGKLETLQKEDQLENPNAMAFEEGLSTIDSLSMSDQSVT